MKWFNNVKIRNKLFTVFGMFLAISVFFSVFAIIEIKNIGDNLNALINSNHAREVVIADAITDVYRMRLSNMSKGYLLEEGLINIVTELNKNYKDSSASFMNNMSAFRSLIFSDSRSTEQEKQSRSNAVDDILNSFSAYVNSIGELDAAADNKDKGEVIRIFEKVIPMGTVLSNKVTELRDMVFATVQQQALETQKTYARTMNIVSFISVVLISLTAFLLFFTVRNINLPISNLEKAVTEIAKGDLSYPIRTERKDELGSLANCIGNMINELVKVNKMTAIMDNLDTMIYVADFNYNLLFANKRLTDIFKLNREEYIGQKCYKVMRNSEAPCSFCKMSEFMAGKDSFPAKDYEYLWDDYLNTWVSGNDSIIRWSDGSSVFSRNLRDSAQKKQQEELLQETLKTAEKASAAKTSFLANMSHEIRTPMNAILGFSEILSRDESLTQNARETLDKIRYSGDLLLSIINDILDLSKIEAGKMELSLAKYNVASLVNDTVSLNLMRKGSKPIDFQLSVDKEIPAALIGDELRIKQILNNLLSNAFKYTQKGIVKMSVSAETRGEGNEPEIILVFTVSDTGQGMTEDQINKLFDEYSRFNGEANRTTEGTGLGMSITRNIVNMMNGRISIKSEVNWGTVFTVYLPQGKTDSEVLGREVAESLQNFELNDAKQIGKAQIVYEPMPYGSVLIVDDVESNLYVAKGLLAPYGLSIDTAASGYEAIDKITDGKVYDIVFMDHMMPKMDGIETVNKIRAMGYTRPIVALTANAVTGQADIFLASGFDGFISKPIDIRQLHAALKQFVRDKQSPGIIEAARQQTIDQGKGKMAAMVQEPDDSKLAGFFVRDASRAIVALEHIHPKDGVYSEDDIQSYIISVHGMKSALANIGEKELSARAAKLEQEGRNRDTALMKLETPVFMNELRTIVRRLKAPEETGEDSEPVDEDRVYLRERLLTIKDECEAYDRESAKAAITELGQQAWPYTIREPLDSMAEQLLNGDFNEVSSTAEKILDLISQD